VKAPNALLSFAVSDQQPDQTRKLLELEQKRDDKIGRVLQKFSTEPKQPAPVDNNPEA